MSNIKNTWKGINLLINGKTRGDHVITALKRPGNGELSHNDDELPNIMNSFFSSIGPNLAARIPQAQKHFSSFLPKQKDAGSLSLNLSPLLKLKLKSCLYHLTRFTDCILVLLVS